MAAAPRAQRPAVPEPLPAATEPLAPPAIQPLAPRCRPPSDPGRAPAAAAGTRYLDPAAGEPALALSSATSLSDVTPAAVLRRLHGRNVTLHARVPSPLWTPDPSPTLRQPSADPGSAAGGFAGLGGGSRAFTIEVLLRVPPQPIW